MRQFCKELYKALGNIWSLINFLGMRLPHPESFVPMVGGGAPWQVTPSCSCTGSVSVLLISECPWPPCGVCPGPNANHWGTDLRRVSGHRGSLWLSHHIPQGQAHGKHSVNICGRKKCWTFRLVSISFCCSHFLLQGWWRGGGRPSVKALALSAVCFVPWGQPWI